MQKVNLSCSRKTEIVANAALGWMVRYPRPHLLLPPPLCSYAPHQTVPGWKTTWLARALHSRIYALPPFKSGQSVGFAASSAANAHAVFVALKPISGFGFQFAIAIGYKMCANNMQRDTHLRLCVELRQSRIVWHWGLVRLWVTTAPPMPPMPPAAESCLLIKPCHSECHT